MLCFKSRFQHTQQNFDGSYTGCRLGSVLTEYKIAAITYKAKHLGLPVYLHDLLRVYQPTRTLRSSTTNKLQRPPLISSFADRSFWIAALPFGTVLSACRHQLDPLTLLVLLNHYLKPICLRQHISPRTVQSYRSASDSHTTRAL